MAPRGAARHEKAEKPQLGQDASQLRRRAALGTHRPLERPIEHEIPPAAFGTKAYMENGSVRHHSKGTDLVIFRYVLRSPRPRSNASALKGMALCGAVCRRETCGVLRSSIIPCSTVRHWRTFSSPGHIGLRRSASAISPPQGLPREILHLRSR